MDKRTVLAIALSILVLLAFQYLFQPAGVINDNISNSEVVESRDMSENVTQLSENQRGTEKTLTNYQLSEIKVENKNLLISFNEYTGNIASIKIKNYDKAGISPEFKYTNNDYFRINDLQTKPVSHRVFEENNKTVVEFTYEKENIIVTRRYFVGDDFLINVKESFANIEDSSMRVPFVVEIGPGLGEGFEDSRYTFQGPIAYNGKKVKSKRAEKVKEDIKIDDALWCGYTSKYFAFIKINLDDNSCTIKKFNDSAIATTFAEVIVNPKDKVEKEFSVFVGPKEYDILASYGYGLKKSIDFGVFSFLAIPMLKVMNIFYDVTKNYGWSIILLTLIIKIITYPLTLKSMTSMKKMKDLQPKMLEIREKFKGDSQKMNAAMMELYRKHGVNPMGGCLPMLIQIPIFFALYKALLVSIELKGAPFIFWIADLSEKDPYYVTPILMGISMFFQQRLTPQAGDPMQQKIFMFMPIIFTFMFLNFPSGLVIYWLTNNILTILQQSIINKKADAR
jgi:YidC/Oxa1 family membrane protein insertase